MKKLVSILACLTMLSACAGHFVPVHNVANIVFGEYVGNIDTSGFTEPSGLVYHLGRKTLFVVGDEGDIAEMHTDGRIVAERHIAHRDFEGIATDSSTGLLYIAVEGEEVILEIDPDSLGIRRTFYIDRTFLGETIMEAGGQGIEGLEFVPDQTHPHGGVFYVVNQAFDTNPADQSVLAKLTVPLNSLTDTTATIESVVSLGIVDLSGLHYDPASNHLFVISDVTNTVSEITLEGAPIRSWALGGKNQEGIAMDAHGNWYIAEDSGGIIRR